jgi:photosystem II stability/assembly factor-like uncharacterized protein
MRVVGIPNVTRGIVFRSSDGGEIWSEIDIGVLSDAVSALAAGGGTFYAGTPDGVAYSTDNGMTWERPVSWPSNRRVRAICANATHAYAGTDSGIFVSTDNGMTWAFSGSGNVSALAMNDTNVYAAISDGGIYRSRDKGSTWTLLNNGLPEDPFTPALAVEGRTVLACGGHRIYLSTDAGDSWSEELAGIPHIQFQAVCVMDTILFAGSEGRGVFRSTTRDPFWILANRGLANTEVRHLAVCGKSIIATSSFEATLPGEYLGLFRSTDDGVTWHEADKGLDKGAVNALIATEDTLFASTTTYNIFRSTDGGVNWSPFTASYPDTTFFLLAASGGTVFADAEYNVGPMYHIGIHRTTDGGKSWIAANAGLPALQRADAFLVSNSTLLAGYAGVGGGIYRSTDKGLSWIASDMAGGITYVTALGEVGGSLLAGTDEGVFRSTDGGRSWSPANSGLRDTSIEVRNFATVGGTVFMACTDGMFLSVDEGASWKEVNEGLESGSLSIAACGLNLFVGTWSRGIWKRPLSEMITSVEGPSAFLPTDYLLMQNYPNPFNPSTTIEFALTYAGFVTLKVYNVLGEEVATLIAGDQAAGTFKATWNASGLPSGVYFYRLTAGEYVQTKKAVLMK